MPSNDEAMFSNERREPGEVAIDYIKASDFKVIWADGLMGSPTPAGHIHFVLYAERPAVPRRQVHRIDANTGQLGDAIPEKTISRSSIVREMACDVLMSPTTALSVAQWLIDQVNRLQASGGSK